VFVYYVVKTLCETEQDKPVVLGSSRVECEPDGTFKPLQCTTGRTECWCVDGLGHEVPNTRTGVYMPSHKPNCGMLYYLLLLLLFKKS